MRSGVLALFLLATLVGVLSVEERDLAIMTKEELIEMMTKKQNIADAKLADADDKIKRLESQLSEYTGETFDEASRATREKTHKAATKKKEAAKSAKKIKKAEKLENVLMHHGAVFLAEIAAKKTADKGSIDQKKAVEAAAKKGARAGAAGPLKKVTRAEAVKAVKAARKAAKKAGKSKKEVRKLAVDAAKKVVESILQKQDKLVESNMKKWVDAAIKKYPPSAILAEDDDTPNVFTAPPGIHLGGEEDEVSPVTDDDDATDAAAAQLAADAIAPEK